MRSKHEYDVALSFAGENRDYVREVAASLRSKNVRVFFDEYEQVNMWGADLYEHLHEVYSSKARYCVIFISSSYAEKIWTTHERKSAQERALSENYDYILPVRFDSTELPGLRTTTNYIDLSGISPNRLSDLIIEKLGNSLVQKNQDDLRKVRLPKTKPANFNPYDEVEKFISYLQMELSRRSELLTPSGASISIFARGDRKCFRLVQNSRAQYSLDVWSGGFASDRGISIYGIKGEIRGASSSINATADFDWDIESNAPILLLQDISLFGVTPQGKKGMKYSEFIERLWNIMIDTLDEK